MTASGTKVADVFVGIGGDLTEYRKTLKSAGTDPALGSLSQQIKTALSGGGAGKAGIAGFIDDLKLGGSVTTALRNNIKGIATDLRGVSTGALSSGLREVETVGSSVFGHLRGLAGEVFKGFAVGAGIAGFLSLERVIEKITSAIPELITKGKEYAESVHTISLETGSSSERSSRLLAIYQFLGGTASDLNAKVNRLSVTIKTNEDAFNALGVQTRDSSGAMLSQLDLIDNLRHRFGELPDGIIKTRLELLSFGRNGATALGPLIHYFDLTDEQINKLAADAKSQGLILSEGQVATADVVDKALNRIGNSITGLAVQIFSDVGPKLSSFFDGLSQYITANAQRIADAISGIVATIIGLVQGLLGIDLGSFSAQFVHLAEGGSQWAGKLIEDQDALDKLKAKQKPVVDLVKAHNDAIDKQIKGLDNAGKAAEKSAKSQTDALDRESDAIDRQAERIKHLGDVQDTVFKRSIGNLTKAYDAELALLDAEDRRIAREEQAQQDARSAEDADRGLAKAKRDAASATVDLANAQARYNKDLAEGADIPIGATTEQINAANEQFQTQIKEDTLAIADAQQKWRDAQQGISDAQQQIGDVQQATADHARQQAEEDRRAEIQATKDYVAQIENIVEDSENKKAALKTLKNREAIIQQRLDAAKAAGDTTGAGDLQTELNAITQGEAQLTAKIKQQADLDTLNARKAAIEEEKKAIASILDARKEELSNEVQALRDSKQTETEVNSAALKKQIADAQAKVDADKQALKDEAAAHKKYQEEVDEGLITTGKTADTATGAVNGAFEKARLAGIGMATDIKNALGGLMDLLLGGADAKGNRTGGLVGAIRGVVDAFGGIGGAIASLSADLDKLTGGDFMPKLFLGLTAAALFTGNWPLALGFAALAGITIASHAGGTPGPSHGGVGPMNPPAGTPGGGGIPGLPNSPGPGWVYDPVKKQWIYPGAAAEGGWVGERGKELRWVGEDEPELVIPRSRLGGGMPIVSPALLHMPATAPQFVSAAPGGGGFAGEIHVHVNVPWGNDAIDFISREMAYRRR